MSAVLDAPPGDRARMTGLLALMGAGWGLTVPLSKIYTSTGLGSLGLIFWQMAIGAVLLSAVNALRGRRLRLTRRALLLYVFIALAGTIIPGIATYAAIRHLPAGVMAIIVAAVPMFAFPMALAMGVDRFSLVRVAGLFLGLFGVALIALPEASLPDPALVVWLPVALIAPFVYAVEGNVVGRWGTGGLDALIVLQGACLAGMAITLPLTLASCQWITPVRSYGLVEASLIGASLLHAIVYALYVWMVGRAGAVFAAQVATLVTGFGVVWSMLILGERYSLWVWMAFVMMLASLSLVAPRRAEAAVK